MFGVHKVGVVDIIIIEDDGVVVRVDEECFKLDPEDWSVLSELVVVGDEVDGFMSEE